jgi:HD-GYP domain-containing protein (c-di-GMP phosphodiesterase class II)
MRPAVRWFVCGVTVAAIAVLFALWRRDGSVHSDYITAAICFSALGLLAQALKYRLGSGAAGSMTFIPFLAFASLAPSWSSMVAAVAATLIAEIGAKRAAIKVVFNTAQYGLATGLSILAYQGMSGSPLLHADVARLSAVAPLAGLFVVFMLTNWTLVSCVIALVERRSPTDVWTENTMSNIVYDLFSFPLLYLFVFVYARFGVNGVLLLALPILGMRQLYKTNWLLEQTNQDLLQLMVAAIEARDPYTSGHSRRVAQYSKIIARASGLTGREVERIGVAALLHDVGKIHEEFAPLLRKEGPLTVEERALMETHPLRSADLVSNVSQLKDVVSCVRHHHENWDGTGYPDGVAGEAIPFASRVIMIADTIDAMTTDRPYRKALGTEEVKAELAKWSGRQFDPRLVRTLSSSTLFPQLFDKARITPTGARRQSGVSHKATA